MKRWKYTEKQMRRHYRGRYGRLEGFYTWADNRHHRRYNKLELHRIMQGKEIDNFLYQHKHNALWEYW